MAMPKTAIPQMATKSCPEKQVNPQTYLHEEGQLPPIFNEVAWNKK